MLVCFIMLVIKIQTYFIVFRSIKTGQSGFISGPSSAGKQSSSSSGRSFSPAGSRPKTSPTALNTSPHRNEHSPAAKSPLLGTAPPGLLPPPDKGQFKPESTFCITTCIYILYPCMCWIYGWKFFLLGGEEKLNFVDFSYDIHVHVHVHVHVICLTFFSSQIVGV